MFRLVALLAVALAVGAGSARAADFSVVVVPGFELSDLQRLEGRGAVGLLVPGAGRRTSEKLASASLVRGKVANSAQGAPTGAVLLTFSTRPVPDRGAVIVLGLPRGGDQPNDRRYPIAVLGHGYRGLLTSDSTRQPGLVTIDDVAPTALGRADALGWERRADAAAAVQALDTEIREHRRSKLPAMVLVVGLTALLALVFPRAGLLASGSALAANLVLGAAGVTSLWVALTVIGLAVAAGAPVVALLARTPATLGALLAGVIAAYLVGLVVDESWIALSPLGPGQNGRYYGLTNVLETLMLLPALAGAVLLRSRFGWSAIAGVGALAFVTVAGNRLGADGGGAVVLAVGFAVLVVGLARAPKRALAVALPVAAAIVLSFVAIDAATGASSHVTHAFEGGPSGLARDLRDRAELSYHNAVAAWYTALIVAASLIGLVVLAVRAFQSALPDDGRAQLAAYLAAIATSLVVNDSPLDISLVGLTCFWALLRFTEAHPAPATGIALPDAAVDARADAPAARIAPDRLASRVGPTRRA
jgi:hypothetical protein